MSGAETAVQGAPLVLTVISYLSTFSMIFVASAWAAGMVRFVHGLLLVLAIQFVAAMTSAILAHIQGWEIGIAMQEPTFWNIFTFLARTNLVGYSAMVAAFFVAEKLKR